MTDPVAAPRPKSRGLVAVFALAFVVIVLVAGAPVISVVVASLLAEANGCTLHEGYSNPCVIWGADRADLLYTMFVAGWFGLVTLPAGAIALLVWLVAAGVAFFLRRR